MVNKLTIKQFLGLSPNMKIQSVVCTERHGSDYGGWTIKQNSITRHSKILSAGIGHDITFDLSIINKYGTNVLAIDPTPQVSEWLSSQSLPPNFVYLPVGLAANDGETKFFKPSDSSHISHSQKPAHGGSQDFITVPVLSIKSLLYNYNWGHIDLMKMDIEGFEYDVIHHIVQHNIPIHQLLVEFHHGLYGFTNSDTTRSIALLNRSGYNIYSISPTGREVSFIKE